MGKTRRSTKQSRPQNASLVKSRKPVKMTATQRRLCAIRSKILCHFKGENPICKTQLRKLKMTFNEIECSLPKEQKIYNAIQEMLAEISAQQTSNSKSSYYDKCTTRTRPKRNIVKYASSDSSLFATSTLMEEKENIPSDSPASLHAMKLRSHNTQNDASINSFPSELLTNTNFEGSQTSSLGAENQNTKNANKHIFEEELEMIIQENGHVEINSNDTTDIQPLDATVENAQAIISECSTNPPIELKSGTISSFTPEDNASSALEIQNTATQNSNYTSQGANIRMSQAIEYDFDETNVTEIIYVDDDDDVGNVDNVPMDDAENEFFGFSETDATLCTVNIPDNNAPVDVNMCNEVDNGSFVFNLEPETSGLVIEETPVVSKPCLVNPPTDKAINQEVDLVKPNETPLIESLSKLAIICASQQNTIDETQYPNSESATFKPNSPAHGRAISPYKLRSRSNSFLNYKASGKSTSLKKRDNAKQSPVNSGFQNMESTATPNLFPSENLMLINGAIHQMDTVANTVEEELSFSDKQKKLKEKVMKRRSKYAPKWSGMSLSEKVSAKFADKFHVRIFDDPVESLTNIEYSPNFENFNFPRLSTKQLHEHMMTSYETTLKMDTALTKVVGEFAEANNDATAFALPTKTANESDSDSSSDEEGASNKKWLKEYAAKTKHETINFMKEMYKQRITYEENNRNMQYINRNNEERDNEDTDELLEEAFRKMGDCDWLKEQEK